MTEFKNSSNAEETSDNKHVSLDLHSKCQVCSLCSIILIHDANHLKSYSKIYGIMREVTPILFLDVHFKNIVWYSSLWY